MYTNKLLFLVILTIGCLAQMASDIYAPSVPAIATSMHTSINLVQWSMAIYMYGIAISLLFYGPISEGYGRRLPLIIGLIIMLSGSLICLLSSNIDVLIIGRFVQGCGAGACSALWRSIFRDVYHGTDLAKYGSYLTIFMIFIVPATPTLGGYLQQYIGWRANFAFLILYAMITTLLVLFTFKETSQYHHIDRLQFKFIKQAYQQLLYSRIFMGYTACTFLCYGAYFSWFITGPVLLIHILKLSPIIFGWITLIGGGIATAIASVLNGKMVGRFGMPFMLRLGWIIMFTAGILMLFGKLLFGINFYVIVAPMILFYFGVTFIWPNAFASAFTPFGKIAGYAAALYGFMQISGAAVIGTLISHLPTINQIPLATLFIVSPMLSWLVFEILIAPNRQQIQ